MIILSKIKVNIKKKIEKRLLKSLHGYIIKWLMETSFWEKGMDEKKVNLRILSKQFIESIEPKGEAFEKKLSLDDSIEIFTEGMLDFTEDDSTLIRYDESEATGLEGVKTSIKYKEGILDIEHFGENSDEQLDLHLETGVVHLTRYVLPMATLDVEVYAHSVKGVLSEEGYGTILADYNVKFDKLLNRRNQLEIEVSPN